MDLDSLLAFLAVAETRSFSQAAEQLHLTQPAVSKRVAALESRLDHALFDRLGREIRLTEAGETLLPQAQAIVQSISDTERSLRELSGDIAGTLRVATSHHIGLHHLPPVLREFASLHPRVNLQFEFLDSEQAHERISHGDCELAVVTLAPRIEAPLQGELIWRDPLVFVAAPEHPLSQYETLSLSLLSRSPALLPDLNTFTGRLVRRCFDQHNLSISLSMATNYLETIKMMTTVGLGWSVLPSSMLDKSLKTLPIHEITLERQLGVVMHTKRTLSNAANAFLGLLREQAKQ